MMLQSVFPWSDVCEDLAVAAGVDPDAIAKQLGDLKNFHDPTWTVDEWGKEQELHEQLLSQLATDLWKALLAGEIVARSANGNPLTSPLGVMHFSGAKRPYVAVKDINDWLAKKGYFQKWIPGIKNLPSKYGTKGYQQEAAILAVMSQSGLDPKKLPPNKGGTNGSKAKLRHALAANPLFAGSTTFDKAWERLRAAGVVRDA